MTTGADGAYRLTRLPSGARIITAPMRERASVAIAVMFAVGSRYEQPENAGIAHFIEHMVFKGSRRYPTAKSISEAIEGVGGVLNAATDKEATLFWAKVPVGKFALAADVLCDMIFNASLDTTELHKERQVVIEELRMYMDNPQDYVQTLFDEVMWPDHPLGRDTAGTEETVKAFEREDCLRYLHEHYRGDNVVISVSGAIEHDEVLAALEPIVGAWGDGARLQAQPAPPRRETPRLRLLNKRTEQANIMLGTEGVSYLDEDRFAADMLNAVLGEGMSSRLFLSLREEQGLAYDVHSFTIKHRDAGALGIYVGCEPKRGAKAAQAAIAELTGLAERRVDDAELTKAREYSKGRLVLQLEGTSSLCNYLGQQELLTDEILLPDEVVRRIDAVSPDDIMRVARRLLDGGLRAAVIGPFRQPERFESLLVS
ncbi:MAG TPA: pitrilysin family protein [Candidatus Dormibacteraeota bacterium]|nr:pitrilysin family protein [Candidatus Dormibacteraeota bacterium]